MTSNKLDSMEFPVLFYVVPKPGLDPVYLALQGYEGAYPYFLGRKNQSTFGWAAASKTVKGILNSKENKLRSKCWDEVVTVKWSKIYKVQANKSSPLNEVLHVYFSRKMFHSM